MAIETFEFIDDLNAANPTATDNVSEGDDHLRGLKTTLKNTFPNVTGAINATETELNYVDGVTSDIQTQLDTKLSSVADNSVTLAKMASGTDGNLITYDASGDPAYVTTGTSGQVLTSGGVGVAPTFQAAAGGGATDIDGLSDGYNDDSSVGLGTDALANDDGTANFNTAIGTSALYNNNNGTRNVAVGYEALIGGGTWVANNIAVGAYTMTNLNSGDYNIAVGDGCGGLLTNASSITIVGANAGYNLTNPFNCSMIGMNSTSSSATVDNQFTLGNTSTNNLRCNDTSISSLSDQRDKAEITDLPESAGLGFVNALRPVTFYWDRREWYEDGVADGSKIKRDWRRWKTNSGMQQGFIAQEVQNAMSGEKCLEDSMIVTDDNPDKLEFAPQKLLINAIKAIQQLSTENEALKIRLTAIENA